MKHINHYATQKGRRLCCQHICTCKRTALITPIAMRPYSSFLCHKSNRTERLAQQYGAQKIHSLPRAPFRACIHLFLHKHNTRNESLRRNWSLHSACLLALGYIFFVHKHKTRITGLEIGVVTECAFSCLHTSILYSDTRLVQKVNKLEPSPKKSRHRKLLRKVVFPVSQTYHKSD